MGFIRKLWETPALPSSHLLRTVESRSNLDRADNITPPPHLKHHFRKRVGSPTAKQTPRSNKTRNTQCSSRRHIKMCRPRQAVTWVRCCCKYHLVTLKLICTLVTQGSSSSIPLSPITPKPSFRVSLCSPRYINVRCIISTGFEICFQYVSSS